MKALKLQAAYFRMQHKESNQHRDFIEDKVSKHTSTIKTNAFK